MSLGNRDQLAVNKKRGRGDISSSGTSFLHDASSRHDALSSIDINKRATELFNKLLSLEEEFPEVKYIAHSETLLESAVKKAMQEASKKRKCESITNRREESGTLYSLPDEVLQNCLSYVGKGHYGLVALASKKLNKAYKIKFGNETAFLEMATCVKLATYCLNELCRMTKDKDEMLRAAAVNGNLDILRYAVLGSGLDLFPLVEMKKERRYYKKFDGKFSIYDEEVHGHLSEIELSFIAEDIYFTDEDEEQSPWTTRIVKLSRVVERGHLHVLKFLHAEFKNGLQRYCRPAIQHGKIEILEWLHNMGYMNPDDKLHNLFDFGTYAVKSGNVEVFDWVLSKNLGFSWDLGIDMKDAIRSKSTEMIQYCFDLEGNMISTLKETEIVIRETKSIDVFHKVHELGYDFKELRKWYDQRKPWEIKDSFEIIMFLRSVSVPWSEKVMRDILQYGTVEMIRASHEDGCPWSSPEGYHACLNSDHSNLEKCAFLMENGYPFDYGLSFVGKLQQKKDLELLELFVGKNSNFDNALFKRIMECKDDLWLEGITFMLEKGKDVMNFTSIEEVVGICKNIEGIKYFQSLGLPWTLDNIANNVLLSRIACFNELDDVKWAYENGCKGGELVQFVKEEWDFSGIRERKWKANRSFFEEKGLLASMNIQEIGDAQLDSKYSSRTSMFFRINYFELNSLVDRGYAFRSDSEKDSIIKEALDKCFKYPSNYNFRKRLALFQQMGVR